MATYSPRGIGLTSMTCGATTLADKQYHYVKLHTDGTVIVASSLGELVIGVLQNKPAVGQACEIVAIGVTKVRADGVTAVAEGSLLTSDAGGRNTNAITGHYVIGVALTTPTNTADVLFTALINCGAPTIAAV